MVQRDLIVRSTSTDAIETAMSPSADLVVEMRSKIDRNQMKNSVLNIFYLKWVACVYRTTCAMKQLK